MTNKLLTISLLFVLVLGCGQTDSPVYTFTDKGQEVPEFNADSAYHFVETQLEFGPRVPNTNAHRETMAYFERTLKKYAGSNAVFTQKFTAEGYDETLELGNVIAAFNTAATNRIMLSAHWDSRPRADMDTVRMDEGILGADDGGSGVAVLLELARLFSEKMPPIGVDIVLLDGEDYGESGSLQKYFLGSKYWSQNPPVPGYSPRFGILLDMVGSEGAQFPKEGFSMAYAPSVVNEVWNIASELGYEDLFPNEEGARVADDHMILNEQAKIPTINIINHRRGENGGAVFGDYWHTHNDNMDIISRETLGAVGEVMAELIYNRL